jgi:hypothetical protein
MNAIQIVSVAFWTIPIAAVWIFPLNDSKKYKLIITMLCLAAMVDRALR